MSFEFPSTQEFREWLEWLSAFGNGTVAGLRRNPYDCPYHHFLRYMGIDVNGVDDREVVIEGKKYPVPKVISRFITVVDDEGELGESVYALECLRILDKVEKEMEHVKI